MNTPPTSFPTDRITALEQALVDVLKRLKELEEKLKDKK